MYGDRPRAPPSDSLAGRLQPCLTCGGTGARGGRLSGKKCKTCKGSKVREVELTKNGKPININELCGGSTVVDGE
jgi:DnaJ-class molecular chaperone